MNDKFNSFTEDDLKKDGEKLFVQLMEKALQNQKSEFQFLGSLEDMLAARQYVRGVKKVLKIFNRVEKKTFKSYLKLVDTDNTDLGVLIALKQFDQCITFYKKEMEIALDMLDEYRAYVTGGHIIDTLLGRPRHEEDLRDFRYTNGGWM